MHTSRTILISAALLALVTVALPVRAQTTLLNVSYDVSRWHHAGMVALSARAPFRHVGPTTSLFNISAVFPLLCGFSSNNV